MCVASGVGDGGSGVGVQDARLHFLKTGLEQIKVPPVKSSAGRLVKVQELLKEPQGLECL